MYVYLLCVHDRFDLRLRFRCHTRALPSMCVFVSWATRLRYPRNARVHFKPYASATPAIRVGLAGHTRMHFQPSQYNWYLFVLLFLTCLISKHCVLANHSSVLVGLQHSWRLVGKSCPDIASERLHGAELRPKKLNDCNDHVNVSVHEPVEHL